MSLLYAAKYVYKVIRLIVIAVCLTFFLGCGAVVVVMLICEHTFASVH